MHQQIRTSPADFRSNLNRVLAALARRGIEPEGIGAERATAHVRVFVVESRWDAAMAALQDDGLDPEPRPAFTKELPHGKGHLKKAVDDLEALDPPASVQAIVTLRSQTSPGRSIVSFGTSRELTEAERQQLGGWEEPNGFLGVMA
jgi:hypothetical protein